MCNYLHIMKILLVDRVERLRRRSLPGPTERRHGCENSHLSVGSLSRVRTVSEQRSGSTLSVLPCGRELPFPVGERLPMIVVGRTRREQFGHRDVVLAGDHVGVLLLVGDSTLDVEDGDPGAVDPWRSRPDLLVADDPRRESPLVGLPYTPSNNSDGQRSDKRWMVRPTGRVGLKGAGVSANPDPASTAAKRGAQP